MGQNVIAVFLHLPSCVSLVLHKFDSMTNESLDETLKQGAVGFGFDANSDNSDGKSK